MGGLSSNLSGLQNKEERVQIVPSFPACSKAGENCISTGCCQVSGHKCFSKGKGKAQCKADRPKGMKDKKWHPTDCSQLTTATAHPLKKPAPFKKCLDEMS